MWEDLGNPDGFATGQVDNFWMREQQGNASNLKHGMRSSSRFSLAHTESRHQNEVDISGFENDDFSDGSSDVKYQLEKRSDLFNSIPKDSAAFSSQRPNKTTSHAESSSRSLEIALCLHPSHASLFKFAHFNRMQAQCWRELYHGLDNVVLSAPTGAGKTVIFELAIFGMLRRSENEEMDSKALYLAPLKSLCCEKVQDWTDRFASLGYGVVEMTGDSTDDAQSGRRPGNSFSGVESARIIVATPEMWDSYVRKSRSLKVVSAVELVCVDEVHTLNLPRRGAVLEGIIARFRTHRHNECEQVLRSQQPVRFVAVSATVPNVVDVGNWLKAKPEHIHVFGPEYRPVPLRVVVRPCRSGKNEFVFQESLNSQLPAVIRDFSGGRATLVFCATKRACENAAKALLQEQGFGERVQPDDGKREFLHHHSQHSVSDGTLKQLIPSGIAIHHAGLSPADRHTVSDLFLQEALMVIFCTQTLALGVNLPARLVIVKGTSSYKENGFVEYDSLEMTQIIGRAGRPQFDTEGIAVILADQRLADRWSQQVLGNQPIESHLADGLGEALLAEVVAGTVQNELAATTWFEGTFLAVRAGQAPQRYASLLACHAQENPLLQSCGPDVRRFLACLCKQELHRLQDAALIQEEQTGSLTATALGKTVCKLSVQVATVAKLSQAQRPQNLQETFELLCSLPDFEEFRPKQGERAQLRELAKKSIRWTFKSPVDTFAKKANVLLQLSLADPPREKLPWDVQMQQMRLVPKASVLMRLLLEYFKGQQQGRVVADAIVLEKCLKRKLWYDSPMQTRQLPNIGDAGADKLLKAGMGTLEALVSGDPRYIELAVGRRPPFGNQLQDMVRSFPRVDMRLSNEGSQVMIEFARRAFMQGCALDVNARQEKPEFAHLVLFGAPTQALLGHRRINLLQPPAKIAFAIPQGLSGLFAKLVYDDIVGLDMTATLGDVQHVLPKAPSKKGVPKLANKAVSKASSPPLAPSVVSQHHVGGYSSAVEQNSLRAPLPKISAERFALANDQRKASSSSKSMEGELVKACANGRKRTSPDSVETDSHNGAILAMVRNKQVSSTSNIQTMRNVRPATVSGSEQRQELPFSCVAPGAQAAPMAQKEQPGFSRASISSAAAMQEPLQPFPRHLPNEIPATRAGAFSWEAQQSVKPFCQQSEAYLERPSHSAQPTHPQQEAVPTVPVSMTSGRRGLFDGIFDAMGFSLSGA